MEVKEKIQTENFVQEVELVKGNFTKSEAAHIVSALIDEKINFHKIQRLQAWEGDHYGRNDALNNRVDELQEQKELAKKAIWAQEGQVNFKIEGTLKISLID